MGAHLLGRRPADRSDDVEPGDDYDVVDGIRVERNMGSESSWIGGELHARLRDYCRANRLGWVWPADSGFACFRRKLVRFPDVSFVRYGRLPGERVPEGHLTIPPDLAAEVVSPHDEVLPFEEKLLDYRDAGVRLVWVIFPNTGTAWVYRPDGSGVFVGEDGLLDGGDVIPGFSVRLADLFPRPPELPAVPEPPAA
ncbi:MAG: Uma2 family endonuclease [Gemmataceae bacterium]|nr:Uma2 family endonuclease [Gemmataceae bacterium]